jgi:hypothetical protein
MHGQGRSYVERYHYCRPVLSDGMGLPAPTANPTLFTHFPSVLFLAVLSFIMYPAWVSHIICHEALRFEPTASLA